MTTPSRHTPDTVVLVAAGILLLAASVVRASETDDRIESLAKKSYVFQRYLADDAIKTESKTGVVTLSGTVAEESHVGLASDTVEALPGVKRVDNQLTVEGERPVEHSDAWVGRKVKTALLFHRNASAARADVNVKDGTVTLSGQASSEAQKKLTTAYAQDVEGVTEVKNEMIVAKITSDPEGATTEKIDDASITAQVKMSLLSHRSTSAVKAKVETIGGVVTLTGLAHSPTEKVMASKSALDVRGVGEVVNNMTIQAVSKTHAPISPPQHLRIVSQ